MHEESELGNLELQCNSNDGKRSNISGRYDSTTYAGTCHVSDYHNDHNYHGSCR